MQSAQYVSLVPEVESYQTSFVIFMYKIIFASATGGYMQTNFSPENSTSSTQSPIGLTPISLVKVLE